MRRRRPPARSGNAVRAALEDRLAAAGLDVFAPRRTEPGDVPGEHDPIF